ncbi:hypothetical protein [Massilia endophytica]|uniref:hypothetical protein n=1 Tax=Massilia endophytica TaxID=2899220 RepID=UPI001E3D2CBF|nr:hypothetical protein [Massilia endophytica]UGQ45764.1 hypothetical protein LSQ66_18530 [Massilia endophytica]
MSALATVLLAAALQAQTGQATECGNLVKKPYNNTPEFFAPDGTRGEGIQIWIDGKAAAIPDTRAGCLPIPLRLNNVGALKTPAKGPWPGQTGKDKKGHAIFSSVEAGIGAWGMWIKRRAEAGPQTAMSIMSLYAPPNDCVGSVGIFPNCPYGPNPTAAYAEAVAASIGKGKDDPLPLDGACGDNRQVLYALLQRIATVEIGNNFCGVHKGSAGSTCVIDRAMFDRAMDKAFTCKAG